MFQVLSFVIAAALLIKGSIALAFPHKFYASRQRQYAATSMPLQLMVPPGRRHREAMGKVVAHPRVWIVDCVLLVVGAGFAALGLFVFPT